MRSSREPGCGSPRPFMAPTLRRFGPAAQPPPGVAAWTREPGDTALSMSEENVEIVRAAIDAYNRGDWDAALKDAGPDFEFDLSRAIGPQHGVCRRNQVQQAWGEFADSWRSVRIEPD